MRCCAGGSRLRQDSGSGPRWRPWHARVGSAPRPRAAKHTRVAHTRAITHADPIEPDPVSGLAACAAVRRRGGAAGRRLRAGDRAGGTLYSGGGMMLMAARCPCAEEPNPSCCGNPNRERATRHTRTTRRVPFVVWVRPSSPGTCDLSGRAVARTSGSGPASAVASRVRDARRVDTLYGWISTSCTTRST